MQAADGMANGALNNFAGISLERLGCDIVVGGIIGVRPLSMGAAVASFATDAAMALAESIKSVVLLRETLVGRKYWGGRIVTCPIRLREPNAGGILNKTCPAQMTHRISIVAGLASRQVLPRAALSAVVGPIDATACQEVEIPADRRHTSVAVNAIHAAGPHRASQAVGDLTGVALVT